MGRQSRWKRRYREAKRQEGEFVCPGPTVMPRRYPILVGVLALALLFFGLEEWEVPSPLFLRELRGTITAAETKTGSHGGKNSRSLHVGGEGPFQYPSYYPSFDEVDATLRTGTPVVLRIHGDDIFALSAGTLSIPYDAIVSARRSNAKGLFLISAVSALAAVLLWFSRSHYRHDHPNTSRRVNNP